MISFFRKNRQNLLATGKTGKYLKYAIGEIFLVVVGILIALGIDGWNTDRIEKNSLKNYYKRIIVELESEANNAEYQKKKLDSLIDYNQRALKIIDSNNIDSLMTLKKLLGATATSWGLIYEFPITREFINQNYLSKIENDSLKLGFELLNSSFQHSETLNDYNISQYVNTIEPFFIQHINYSETVLPRYAKGLIQGGPETQYEDLLNNLELWNIITFKLESLITESGNLGNTIQVLDFLKKQLKKEIES
ncbi:hypothetical protein [Reichenbachiella ulvae]|uniref:Uncharacterized protein n=1 Tax=Reichenbachiella ulvae TaxID=2980104 RepID=A0ABT3CTW2_9BACT|nr:hypothetical protein [Reichenbachiella ulvae]MCV9387145.1 hypothetical protein [Reichenbachiella ulvae]